MEIRYIWIEEFRGILENIDLNFQHPGDHKFNYSNGKLNAITNHQSILEFGKNIIGITAIAGRNGSGKSSICELVLHAAATYVNGGLSYYFPFKGIVGYGNRIFHSSNIIVENIEELVALGYVVLKFDETPLEKVPYEWKQDFHKSSFIYYNNALDWRTDISLNNLTNISTQYLLGTDHTTGTAILPDYDDKTKLPDYFGTHYDGEGYRSTKFYLDFHGDLPVPDPSSFILRNSYSGNNRYINYRKSFEYVEYSDFANLEQSILTSVLSYPFPPDSNDELPIIEAKSKQAMMQLYRFNLLLVSNLNRKKLPDYRLSSAFVYDGDIREGLFKDADAARVLLLLYEQIVANSSVRGTYRTYELKKGYLNGHQFKLIEHLTFNNNSENRGILKEFLYKEESFLKGDDYYMKRVTNYALAPYQSSGEKAYYSFFSRLYDAIQKYDIGYDEREEIVLFIDEGEIGFHPDWKKRFLKWILDFLNAEFNRYRFQIILTTHSPYLLSDLCSENILLLDKKAGKTQIVATENFQTFGANIHELLADAFFMTDGQIGEFAKQKIQAVIDNLNYWRELKNDTLKDERFSVARETRDACRKLIGLIADSIIRKKLMQMYADLFEDQESIEQEIALLESRIVNLKNRKK